MNEAEPLRECEVEFVVEVERDDAPVRGNSIASGDDDQDKEVEDEIISRLDRGDVWAWALVTVIAKWRGFEGKDYLGMCSYGNEREFKRDGYYSDMKARALEELNRTVGGEP